MTHADLRYEHEGSVLIARLAGDVDMSNAEDIGNAILRALDNEMHAAVLDLTGVDYFDSAGIHLVYDLRERLTTRGQQLRLVVPQVSNVRDTFRLAGVLGAVQVDETVEDAQQALGGG